MSLLEITDLKVHYPIKGGFFGRVVDTVQAVNGINISINEGETYGLVGESGCGKTTTGRAILGLNKITDGTIMFDSEPVSKMFNKNNHPLREDVQMIFQDPYSSLNPKKRVRDIIAEPLNNFTKLSEEEKTEKVKEMMARVGLNEDAINKFPHQFSGGQRQRIGIARALMLNPRLIIADEPVSALDVSVQAQVLNFMKEIQEDFNLTYLFISHDLGIVRHMCNRIGVMHRGQIVEEGTPEDIFENAQHIYTKKLIASIPTKHPSEREAKIALRHEVEEAQKNNTTAFYDEGGRPYPLKKISETHAVSMK